MKGHCQTAIYAGFLLAAHVAGAQALVDPTKPPSPTTKPATGDAQSGDPAAPASRLQSILISSRHSSAVIDGVLVPLGGRVGDARLVSVDVDKVALRKANGETEVLKLHPSVEKKPPR